MEVIKKAKTVEELKQEEIMLNLYNGWVVETPEYLMFYSTRPKWVGKREKPAHIKKLLPRGAKYTLWKCENGKCRFINQWINS